MLGGQFGKQKRWVFPVPQWDARKAEHVEDAPTSKISSAAWRKACIRAGLPTLRFHDLGHTWASWARSERDAAADRERVGGLGVADAGRAQRAPREIAHRRVSGQQSRYKSGTSRFRRHNGERRRSAALRGEKHGGP